ncbi:MAG TPA: hypothetical protein VH020_04785 [Stellaceae bacterium]|jgi:hypothetical protein|nr:hypothetical protein [Stellaceae bacterium]
MTVVDRPQNIVLPDPMRAFLKKRHGCENAKDGVEPVTEVRAVSVNLS